MEAAFAAAKTALCRVTSLAHPDPSAAISLACDASDSHVGAVLQQWSPKGWQPLSFYSKKLDVTQRKYSTFDRELLAVYLAVRHFRFLLEGRQFHVETDHKPLTFALHRMSEPWSARQQRQLSYLAEFTSDIRHVPGSQNLVADTLSRPPAGDVKEPSGSSPGKGPPQQLVAPVVGHSQGTRVDLEAMARGQQACAETSATLQSSSLQCLQVRMGSQLLWCDVSRGPPRPLVPQSFRKVVFEALHSIAHPGILASKRLISARFVWKGMAKDITAWCRDCQDCARSKVTAHARAAVQPI
jgi:cleavage and polyadenylation specificity factor subunit 1